MNSLLTFPARLLGEINLGVLTLQTLLARAEFVELVRDIRNKTYDIVLDMYITHWNNLHQTAYFLKVMYVHSVYMAKRRATVRARRQYRRTFLREWRKYRDLTLEKVAEQVGQRLGRKFTHASLSRIERGLQPYSQGILEALADIYDTSVVALLMQSPSDSEGIWPIWEQASPSERKAIVEVSRALVKSGSKK